MARNNPTLTTERTGLKMPLGIDLINADGVSSENLADANEFPKVNMTPNDGDNPTVSDAPFANGTDGRNRSGGISTPPSPGMPGA